VRKEFDFLTLRFAPTLWGSNPSLFSPCVLLNFANRGEKLRLRQGAKLENIGLSDNLIV
jgi:hypothetical protein